MAFKCSSSYNMSSDGWEGFFKTTLLRWVDVKKAYTHVSLTSPAFPGGIFSTLGKNVADLKSFEWSLNAFSKQFFFDVFMLYGRKLFC